MHLNLDDGVSLDPPSEATTTVYDAIEGGEGMSDLIRTFMR